MTTYNDFEVLVDYAVTKVCGMSVTKSIPIQLAPKGMRINAVAPSPIGRLL